MNSRLTAVFVLLCLFLTSSLTAYANDIRVSYSADSNDTTDSLLDLSFDLNQQTQLHLGGGESTIKDSSGEITNNQYNFSLSGIADDQIDYDIGYSYWGNDTELTTDTYHIGLSLFTQDWKFTIRPELQQIALYTKGVNRRQIDIDGDGFYNSIEYFGFNKFKLLYAHTSYHYDRDLSTLNTRLADLFFSNTSLLLSGNFLEKKDQAEISYNPTSNFINLSRIALLYSQTLAAVDKSHSETVALNLQFDLSKSIKLALEGGTVTPELNETLRYGSLAITYKY